MPISTTLQDTIRVDVDFYDNAERRKLLGFPSASAIQEAVKNGIELPTAEFLAYYLFHRKRMGTGGYRDYPTIARKWNVALASLDECVDFNGHSICTPAGAVRQLNEVSEHIGEAIGLAVVSRIHNLTHADWKPISEQHGRGAAPTFDFQLASEGHCFIQVENKGSSVADNRALDAAVQAQKRRIADKKTKLTALASQGKDPNPAGLRYGTITAVDPRRDGNVRCWLVDPVPEQHGETPQRFRLLRQMHFLRDWIAFISPGSQLASALATRVTDLEALQDPFELNGVPLRRGNGEPFEFAPLSSYSPHSVFLTNKSRIADSPAGGVVVQLSGRALFLAGIREELLAMASRQSFGQILDHKSEAGTLDKVVECVFSQRRLQSLRLPSSVRDQSTQSGGYVRFRLSGVVHYSHSGLVFGVIPLPVK